MYSHRYISVFLALLSAACADSTGAPDAGDCGDVTAELRELSDDELLTYRLAETDSGCRDALTAEYSRRNKMLETLATENSEAKKICAALAEKYGEDFDPAACERDIIVDAF